MSVREPKTLPSPKRSSRWSSFAALVTCCLLVLSVWTFVLPTLSRQPSYRARQQLFDERRIDPSAMFYTELECLDRALDETRRLR
jgi:hypothetical protein